MRKNAEKQKRLVSNTFYTMGGMLALNGVLQLVITPLLNRELGARAAGGYAFCAGAGEYSLSFCGAGFKYQPSGGAPGLPCNERGLSQDLTAFWNTGKFGCLMDMQEKLSWNIYGSRDFPASASDGFPILWRCGIQAEPELPTVFYLLCADCSRLSGRLWYLSDYGKTGSGSI